MFALPTSSAEVQALWDRTGRLKSAFEPFILPALEGDAPGTERLLDGLVAALSASPSGKGKEREVQLLVQESLPVSSAPVAPIHAQDMWETAYEDSQAGPSRTFKPLRTWDVMEGDTSDTYLLSDRLSAFDALATSLEPAPRLPRLAGQLQPPEDAEKLLHTLIRATLGTTTTRGIVWDRRQARFKRTGGRIQGLGSSTSSYAPERFLDVATALRRLEIILDSHATTPLTPTHHAFLHAVTTLVTYTKQLLSEFIEVAEKKGLGWLASSSVLDQASELALLLCEIMCWPVATPNAQGLPARASSLLTHLHSHLLAHFATSSQQTISCLAMAYLLSQASEPFLDLLHAWLGLAVSSADEDADPTSQPWLDLGITRTPLSTSSETGTQRWTYTFSSKMMPGFIPRDTRRTLFEAGKSLRLLRDASARQHPLCSTSWALEAGWGWGKQRASSSKATLRAHARRVHHEVDQWRQETLNLSHSAHSFRLTKPKQRKKLPDEFTHPEASEMTNLPSAELDALDSLWSQFEQPPGSHLSDTLTPLWAPSPLSSLQSFLTHHQTTPLLPADCPTLDIFISIHLLAPLLSHADLVSTSLVSLYLDDLDLLEHYDILRAYFLGGDVDFSERVSGALFGKEEAGAGEALGMGKRARTRARLGLGQDTLSEARAQMDTTEEGEWGIGLGLGLSERARWPPGGAELAYALRTTLVDDVPRHGVWSGIEDRVSFAVRSIPEDDKDGQRARWMNPQGKSSSYGIKLTGEAIEALDFLYLVYSPPQAIGQLLPSSLMGKYRTIHNFLLRLSRIKVVLRSMYIDIVHRTPQFEEPVKHGVDFRSNSRRDRPTPGVVHDLFPPDSPACAVLNRVRFRMSAFVAAFEAYVLDTAIEVNWTKMRRRLDTLRHKNHHTSRTQYGTRPSTPAEELDPDDVLYSPPEYPSGGDEHGEAEESEAEQGGYSPAAQLHSLHSLVTYHHLILDRILRQSLLGQSGGQQVTMKVLTCLLGLILDLGKLVKRVSRGSLGWEDGAEQVLSIAKEWDEREAIFLHALERLSLRTGTGDTREERDHAGNDDERDLEILLEDIEDDTHPHRATTDQGGLAELLLRLRLISPPAPTPRPQKA